jgi:hypothetical protein
MLLFPNVYIRLSMTSTSIPKPYYFRLANVLRCLQPQILIPDLSLTLSTVPLYGYMLLYVSIAWTTEYVMTPTGKLFEALVEIPDLTLLDVTDVCHEVRNLAS